MAESKVSRYTAETLTDLLEKYVSSVKELSHLINDLSDSASKSSGTEDDVGQVISHLQELGDDIKEFFTDKTHINESWSNLGQNMDSGLKLVTKLLQKYRPDPVQELCFGWSIKVSISRKEKKALRQHKAEIDGRVKDMLRTIPCTDFFKQHRADLEHRMPLLGPILSRLEHEGVLNDAERDEVESRPTEFQKNHVLLRILLKKGTRAQESFYEILKQTDRHLVEDLENPKQ